MKRSPSKRVPPMRLAHNQHVPAFEHVPQGILAVSPGQTIQGGSNFTAGNAQAQVAMHAPAMQYTVSPF